MTIFILFFHWKRERGRWKNEEGEMGENGGGRTSDPDPASCQSKPKVNPSLLLQLHLL